MAKVDKHTAFDDEKYQEHRKAWFNVIPKSAFFSAVGRNAGTVNFALASAAIAAIVAGALTIPVWGIVALIAGAFAAAGVNAYAAYRDEKISKTADLTYRESRQIADARVNAQEMAIALKDTLGEELKDIKKESCQTQAAVVQLQKRMLDLQAQKTPLESVQPKPAVLSGQNNLKGKTIVLVESASLLDLLDEDAIRAYRYAEALEQAGAKIIYPKTSPINYKIHPEQVEAVMKEILAMQPKPDAIVVHHPHLGSNVAASDANLVAHPAIKLGNGLKSLGVPVVVLDTLKLQEEFTAVEQKIIRDTGMRYIRSVGTSASDFAVIMTQIVADKTKSCGCSGNAMSAA